MQKIQNLIRRLSYHQGALPMSWSRINCMLTCPRMFDLRYRKKIKDTCVAADPSAAEAGKLIHTVLEYAVNKCNYAGYKYDYKNTSYEGFWERYYNATDSEATKERLTALRKPSACVLNKVLGWARTLNAKIYTETELRLDHNWEWQHKRSWQKMAYVGYVDVEVATKSRVYIIDYKSEKFSQERNDSTEMQTLIYTNAVFARNPSVQKVQTGCAYLLDMKIVPNKMLTRDELPQITDRLYDLFSRYLDALESGCTEPRASKMCTWCGYSAECPVK